MQPQRCNNDVKLLFLETYITEGKKHCFKGGISDSRSQLRGAESDGEMLIITLLSVTLFSRHKTITPFGHVRF